MTSARVYYVYRLYDADDRLLYIGCSRNLKGRQRDHAWSKFWWPLVRTYRLTGPFADKRSAYDYERSAIHAEVPRFNQLSNVNFMDTAATHAETLRLAEADLRARRPRTPSVLPSAGARTA